jgi:hypothetical protein
MVFARRAWHAVRRNKSSVGAAVADSQIELVRPGTKGYGSR